MNSAGTLSRNEVRRISSRAIRGYDKWHRMWAGIASELERYEENIMYLRIENTEKTWPSNHQTAEKFARMWSNWNEGLTHAEGFVVSFYKVGTTGSVIAGKDMLHKRGLVYERIQELIAENKRTHKLVSIFSGIFEETKKEEEQSWAQHNKQPEQRVQPTTKEQSDSIEELTDKQGEGCIIGL